VSPLWRDELAIYLAPRKIALARRPRGIRPRVSVAAEVAVPDGSIADNAPALAKLAEVLNEPTWHDASVRIVIADPWARFAIVPAATSRLDAQGHQAHARYLLADTYGDGLADWIVALEDKAPGRMSVACAMPAGLKPALDDMLAPHRLKLVSMQPQLVVAYNAWRSRLPRDDAWFVTLEDGWLSAVHVAKGIWDRVHMARLSSDPSVELERLRAFGRLTRAAGAGRMFVEAPLWLRERAKLTGSDIEWLEADDADGGSPHELALLLRANA
jgi:hypothetical protein